jgi:hypothetical protein
MHLNLKMATCQCIEHYEPYHRQVSYELKTSAISQHFPFKKLHHYF